MTMQKEKVYKFISVDLQKDFTEKGGVCFEKRDSVDFIKEHLIPFFKEKGIKIDEIVSDYRQPRPGDRGDCCHPGEKGYESILPREIVKSQFVKCMNQPTWTRENIGDASQKPGIPYQNPIAFESWLNENIGEPQDSVEIVIFGLTLDCCVLCAAIELNLRGYKVKILEEAVDIYSGKKDEKVFIINNPPLTNWTEKISWDKIVDMYISKNL